MNVKSCFTGLSMQMSSWVPSVKTAILTEPSAPGSPGSYRAISLISEPEKERDVEFHRLLGDAFKHEMHSDFAGHLVSLRLD